MCGACGQTVVRDPLLGPVRTLRQHLIVAQTVNQVCQLWAGAPKVTATSGGWLVSWPTGATEAVSTVDALWTAVLGATAGARGQNDALDAQPVPASGAGDLPNRVLALGRRLSHQPATG
ncbi:MULTISPECIES: hypothetical protein [unclassified Arthrobacter]|uniref:hypothetical protein n=1 Tax=unclassified Arthrobacter TaxID=235627 RepID=UPI002DFF37D7|nr:MULTISPECIES: hypothetical protein [unclassified Arthrobacter]MEC5191508.1 hypothetical protein [Arthrobacter sp. MP_M4]MEC5203091.1 hypothetical protein [Arthrobacter sp. MP_M7]